MPSTVTDRVSGVGGAVSPPAVSTLPPGGASPTNVLERVPGIGSGVGIPIQDIVIRVDDRVELAALPADYIVAFLQEAGREGLFKRTIANLSAFVTNDPQQGVYVASDSDPTGASGAWVRIYDGSTRLSWFGAVGNGVTNDSAAIQAWLQYLCENRKSGFVSAGTYLMNTQAVANIGGLLGQDEITIFGESKFVSRFVAAKANTSGCLKITVDDNSCNVVVHSVGFGSKLDNRITAERDAPNGTALWIDATLGPGDAGFGSHSTHSVVVRDCDFGAEADNIAGWALYGSWGRCLRIDNMWYVKVHDCMFRGLSNVSTTTYDPKTRVAGINVAAIDLRSCFAPEIRGCIANGYFDYGAYHLGEATTGNAEQGGIIANCVLASQRNSILIDHSNATGPTPYHSGFQICDNHINGNDYGVRVVQHAKVQISNCQFFASYNTENSVNLTAGIYLEDSADVIVSGCSFTEPGYYVSDTECWNGIYVASTFKNGFVASGCQFSAGGVGISYHTSFPGFVFSSIWDGQIVGGIWATMKQFVDTTGYLVIDGGPPDTAKGVKRITSGRTDATVSPRFALVSQRTDFAANPTSDMGALDIRSLNSTGVEKIAALIWATWLDNVTGSEDVQVNWGWLDNNVLKNLSISANTKLFNLPSGYNFAVAGVPLSAANSYLASSVAGTNAVTAVTSPSFAAYPSDGIVYIKMPVNSAAVTLALNGLAARAVNFGSGAALAGGEFSGTQTCALRILATTFEIVSGV